MRPHPNTPRRAAAPKPVTRAPALADIQSDQPAQNQTGKPKTPTDKTILGTKRDYRPPRTRPHPHGPSQRADENPILDPCRAETDDNESKMGD